MKKLFIVSLMALFCFAEDGLARGGVSSGGGRGGFSSSRSYSSSPSRSYSAPSRSTTTTTTTRSSSYGGRGGYYGGGYGYSPMMYPGFGMGYGYYGGNGLLTGIIIGSMMHPQGTIAYTGGGYNGQALLYPDGRVVDQNGYQVGTYQNGQYTAQQGGMVAQPAPSDARMPQAQGPQPVQIVETGPSGWDIFGGIVIGFLIIFIIVAMAA